MAWKNFIQHRLADATLIDHNALKELDGVPILGEADAADERTEAKARLNCAF